jgi:hypothetical protein
VHIGGEGGALEGSNLMWLKILYEVSRFTFTCQILLNVYESGTKWSSLPLGWHQPLSPDTRNPVGLPNKNQDDSKKSHSSHPKGQVCYNVVIPCSVTVCWLFLYEIEAWIAASLSTAPSILCAYCMKMTFINNGGVMIFYILRRDYFDLKMTNNVVLGHL